MKEVKRYVSPYSAGTESAKFGHLKEVTDFPREPDHDEGPFFVLASDYDSLLRKFAEVERDAARYRAARQMLCYPYANIAGTVFRNEHDCDKACDEWFAAMPGEG